jgi:hypothetical protein
MMALERPLTDMGIPYYVLNVAIPGIDPEKEYARLVMPRGNSKPMNYKE